MTTQQNPLNYAKAIQYQLSQVVNPVPVYANFNRNFATQPDFVTWQLRNVHQPVYTGSTQNVKGIDTPIFQATVFGQDMNNAFNNANLIIQALHGYAGQFGGTSGFDVSKIDISWLFNTYDDQVKLHQVVLDCRMYIPC
jgi:hypothetical protein